MSVCVNVCGCNKRKYGDSHITHTHTQNVLSAMLELVKKGDVWKMWCNHVKCSLVQSASTMTTSSESACHSRVETHLHQFSLRRMKRDNTKKIREEKWKRRWEDKKGLKITIEAVRKAMMKEHIRGKGRERKKRNQSNGKVGIKLRVMVRSGVEQETIVTLFNATVIKFAHILLKIL